MITGRIFQNCRKFCRPSTPLSRTAWYSTKSIDAAVEDIFLLRNFSTVSSALEKELQIYSNKKQTPVSLRSLMETGSGDRLPAFDEMMKLDKKGIPQASQRIMIQVACFLHRELPIRLAQRAVKLEASPLFIRSGKLFDFQNNLYIVDFF